MGVPKPLEEILIARPEEFTPSTDECMVIAGTNPAGTRDENGNKKRICQGVL